MTDMVRSQNRRQQHGLATDVLDRMTSAEPNVGEAERVLSVVAGAGMVAWGVRHGGIAGMVAGVAGAALAARGFSGYCPVYASIGASSEERRFAQEHGWSTAASTMQRVTINKPKSEVYRFWRNFQNLPRFMENIERVDVQSNDRSHWVVKAPAGSRVEWDAIVTDDRTDERIAWESDENADVRNAGWVEFRDAPGGTEVRALIAYEPPGGELGRILASLWGREPGQQAQADLHRLKRMLESGEAARDTSLH
jgi:uncharacterized membrane protein